MGLLCVEGVARKRPTNPCFSIRYQFLLVGGYYSTHWSPYIILLLPGIAIKLMHSLVDLKPILLFPPSPSFPSCFAARKKPLRTFYTFSNKLTAASTGWMDTKTDWCGRSNNILVCVKHKEGFVILSLYLIRTHPLLHPRCLVWRGEVKSKQDYYYSVNYKLISLWATCTIA